MNKGYFSGVRRNLRSSSNQGFNEDQVVFTPPEDDPLSVRNFLNGFKPPHSRHKNKRTRVQRRYSVDKIGTDLMAWRATRVDQGLPETGNYQHRSVAFGEDVWISVGNTGTRYASRSTDGVTWTSLNLPLSGTALNCVAFGNNLWVAVGNSGVLRTSSNTGTSWTTRTSNFGTTAINSVAYGNNLWVAGGNAGQIRTSTDAVTWTTRTSNFGTTNILCVAYGNNLWVAGGNFGELRTSTDAITWVTQTSNLGTLSINSVAYGNGLWVINNGIYIRSSTDAVTWVTRTSLPSSSVYCLGYYNDVWVVGGSSTLYLSTDLNAWEIKSPLPTQTGGSGNPNPIYSLAYGKGVLVGVGFYQIRSGPFGYYRYKQVLSYGDYSEYVVQ